MIITPAPLAGCLLIGRGRTFSSTLSGWGARKKQSARLQEMQNQPCQCSISLEEGVPPIGLLNPSASLKQNQRPWMPTLASKFWAGLLWLACEFVVYHAATLGETHFIDLNTLSWGRHIYPRVV